VHLRSGAEVMNGGVTPPGCQVLMAGELSLCLSQARLLPDDGSAMFLRNVASLPTVYTALVPEGKPLRPMNAVSVHRQGQLRAGVKNAWMLASICAEHGHNTPVGRGREGEGPGRRGRAGSRHQAAAYRAEAGVGIQHLRPANPRQESGALSRDYRGLCAPGSYCCYIQGGGHSRVQAGTQPTLANPAITHISEAKDSPTNKLRGL
jgi:hypothetical protein